MIHSLNLDTLELVNMRTRNLSSTEQYLYLMNLRGMNFDGEEWVRDERLAELISESVFRQLLESVP